MLELLFVMGFFIMLMATGVSLLGILAALMVATAVIWRQSILSRAGVAASRLRPSQG